MSDRPDHAVALGVAKRLPAARALLLHQIHEKRAQTPMTVERQAVQRRLLDEMHTLGLLAEPGVRAALTPLGLAVHAIWLGRKR